MAAVRVARAVQVLCLGSALQAVVAVKTVLLVLVAATAAQAEVVLVAAQETIGPAPASFTGLAVVVVVMLLSVPGQTCGLVDSAEVAQALRYEQAALSTMAAVAVAAEPKVREATAG